MKKEKYEKPAIDAFELDDDIILASGCVDVCDDVVCTGLCDDCNTLQQ